MACFPIVREPAFFGEQVFRESDFFTFVEILSENFHISLSSEPTAGS
jgi:hypothetical protein